MPCAAAGFSVAGSSVGAGLSTAALGLGLGVQITGPAALAEVARLTAERDALAAQVARGDASDGYHTHNELYEYRMLYNAHAARGWLAAGIPVVKSWTHSDGEPCFGGGWFVVAATLPTGQVSNHYRAEYWDLFDAPEDAPPEYDGHTPADAADRLRAALAEPTGQEADHA